MLMINLFTLKKVLRVAVTLIFTVLLIEGLLGALSYSKSTYGCGYDDFIAADPNTAGIYLLLCLPIAFFIFVNVVRLLNRKQASSKKWYTKLWLQIVIVIALVFASIVVAFSSDQFISGYCF
jgi:predicted lysophospholipase L1 biosynthesis ABC-type transport system permease subunit